MMTSLQAAAEGWREAVSDTVTESPLRALAATLGLDDLRFEPGLPAPPGWHWLFCKPAPPRGDLRPDGHPRHQGFLVPPEFPRRMWAGSRMRFFEPLRVGEEVRRESSIAAFTEKTGRSGRLLFTTIEHRYTATRGPAVEEEQDVVYLASERAAGESRPVEPPGAPEWSEEVQPDSILLFRFSALIFNSHRIHYDRPYAIEAEGYRGLVVHGPLTAILLLDLYRRRDGRPPAGFSFRAVNPLFDDAPFTVAGRRSPDGQGCELWALTPEGYVAMQAAVRTA